MTTNPARQAVPAHATAAEKGVGTIDFELVEAPSQALDDSVRRFFAQFGEEHPQLCDRLFAEDPDLSLS
ncbi:MAG: hypothetical protein OXG55_16275 [bacterium]|nr:hypothetical protein [bacterium]MCY4104793.1 hypothetical protein [bacterium]